MLTNCLAFLIYLDGEVDPTTDRIAGRVEHLDSGERVTFANPESLAAFLTAHAQQFVRARNAAATATGASVSQTAVDGRGAEGVRNAVGTSTR